MFHFQLKHFRSFEICKNGTNIITLSNTAVVVMLNMFAFMKAN